MVKVYFTGLVYISIEMIVMKRASQRCLISIMSCKHLTLFLRNRGTEVCGTRKGEQFHSKKSRSVKWDLFDTGKGSIRSQLSPIFNQETCRLRIIDRGNLVFYYDPGFLFIFFILFLLCYTFSSTPLAFSPPSFCSVPWSPYSQFT